MSDGPTPARLAPFPARRAPHPMDGQPQMFDPHEGTDPERISLPGADVVLHRFAFTAAEAERCFHEVLHTTAWRHDEVVLYGKLTPIPRLQAWYGEPGCTYTYSNLRLDPLPFTPALSALRARCIALAGATLNCALVNHYRDGRDSVALHADDEPELGPEPVIASVSLGAVRRMQFRHQTDPDLRHDLDLPSGSVLVMRGTTQRFWRHAIPKTTRPVGPRLNLTFRHIAPHPIPEPPPHPEPPPPSRTGHTF